MKNLQNNMSGEREFHIPKTDIFLLQFLSKLKINIRGFFSIDNSTWVLISPLPDQEGNKLTFLPELCEFPSAPCLVGKKYLMTTRVSMLKSFMSLASV